MAAKPARRSPFEAAVTAATSVAAIFERDARNALSYSAYFYSQWFAIGVEVTIAFYLSLLILPSTKFGFHGHVGSYFAYLVVSFAFVTFQNNAMLSFAESVREGQTTGTLEAVLATPTALPLIILSTGVWSFGLTTLKVVFYFALAMCFGLDLHHVNPLTAIVFLVLTVAAVSPIGVFAAGATMLFKKTGPIAFSVNSATNLFGGVYIPLAKLPLALQWIGWMLPITHALNGFRGALYGASLRDMQTEIWWLVGLTAVLMPASLYLFSRAVHRAKVDGSLGLY
jgi:ABC-type polysaccharide/polyol phosphate export permease